MAYVSLRLLSYHLSLRLLLIVASFWFVCWDEIFSLIPKMIISLAKSPVRALERFVVILPKISLKIIKNSSFHKKGSIE